MKAIINGKILLPDGVVSGKALLFDRAVTGLSDTVPADCETIDAQGLYVSPGFVDVHIHGYLGEDASDGSLDGLRRMARGILQNGVTSFLPTTMTVAWEELTRAFETIRAFMAESAQPDFDGARALGCHAEGPFINPAKKGAPGGQRHPVPGCKSSPALARYPAAGHAGSRNARRHGLRARAARGGHCRFHRSYQRGWRYLLCRAGSRSRSLYPHLQRHVAADPSRRGRGGRGAGL